MAGDALPFLYLGPSACDYRKALECDIWFKSEVKPDERQAIDKLIPYPLVLNRWSSCCLHLATDDLFSQRTRTRYGNFFGRVHAKFGGKYTLANPAGLVAFHKLLDSRLQAINRTHPYCFS